MGDLKLLKIHLVDSSIDLGNDGLKKHVFDVGKKASSVDELFHEVSNILKKN